jgi:hypothetical protein
MLPCPATGLTGLFLFAENTICKFCKFLILLLQKLQNIHFFLTQELNSAILPGII